MNTNHPTNISLQRQKPKGRRNTTLKPEKRRSEVEQIREKNDEKTENYRTNGDQGKNSQDQINEEEINRFPEREFRLMALKMLQSLEIEWKNARNIEHS